MFDINYLSGLFTDEDFQNVDLYSLSKEKVVFSGTIREASLSEFGNYMIESIDTLFEPSNVLVINIK